MQEKGPLPEDAKAFANDVDAWLRTGGKNPEPSPMSQEEIDSRKAISDNLSSIFIDFSFRGRFLGDLRLEAMRAHGRFSNWKQGVLRGIRDIEALKEEEREDYFVVMDTFSLSNVAAFADKKYEEAGRGVGKADMGSKQWENASIKAEWWSTVQQITRSAAELGD